MKNVLVVKENDPASNPLQEEVSSDTDSTSPMALNGFLSVIEKTGVDNSIIVDLALWKEGNVLLWVYYLTSTLAANPSPGTNISQINNIVNFLEAYTAVISLREAED